MQCEDFQEDLVSFVLNELSDDRSKTVRKHLDSCEKCGQEVSRYRQTMQALSRWEIPEHNRPPIFAFPAKSTTKVDVPWSRTQPARRFAAFGAAAAFVMIIGSLFIFGTQMRYESGTLTITIGTMAFQPSASDSTRIAAAIENVRRQDLQIMSELLKSSEAHQAEVYRANLASFSRHLNDQQRSYLAYVMVHIYHLQQQDQLAYYQSRVALDGVIKLANSSR